MFDIGGGELLLIVMLILLLFGPNKIPEFAKYLKKGVTQVRKAQQEFKQQMDDITQDIDKSINSQDKKDSDKKNSKD